MEYYKESFNYIKVIIIADYVCKKNHVIWNMSKIMNCLKNKKKSELIFKCRHTVMLSGITKAT